MRRKGRPFYASILRGAIIFSFFNYFCFFCFSVSMAQEQTVGLFQYDKSVADGYTLFTPMSSTMTYLMDNYGRTVHTWESSYVPAASVYLLENGNLLRTARLTGTAGSGGGIQIFDWDGNLIWDYVYDSETFRQHHDIEPLPNGNVLILAWEFKTAEEAIAAGRDPLLIADSAVWPEQILEVQPTGLTTGNIVWQWNLWDHLIQDYDSTKDNFGVVADHAELMDLNYTSNTNPDWIHANGFDYSPELDQIVISSHHTNEIWIIDHSTTTLEAAGHNGGSSGQGGDIIYRWGNPIVYRAGTVEDQKLFGQHDPRWIEPGLPGEGNILIHNNGRGRPEGNYSTIEELATPISINGDYPHLIAGNAYGPANPEWNYTADPPESFYSAIISGMQRLPNGNTLICSGRPGRFFELNSADEIVWEYISPITSPGPMAQGDTLNVGSNMVFRCQRFSSDYPGLAGYDLTPGSLLELYPVTIAGTIHTPGQPTSSDPLMVTTMIEATFTPLSVALVVDTGDGIFTMAMDLDSSDANGYFYYQATIAPMPENTAGDYYLDINIDAETSIFDPPLAPAILYQFSVSGSESFVCGDANSDARVNVGDAVFMVNFVFKGGAAPIPYEAGDVNCDGVSNVGDAVYLVNHIFKNGAAPCEACQ